MSHASLAARYRPQTFAEVTGQETIKSILSRSAAEDKIAPAYLLSGTRGVGKTTIARIFAKALNCTNAPTAEPCNQCEACRNITQGNFVDVVEIDGASNNGIEEARRLRETIGYAPMEGRYKVFIIDEAHMLSKAAFNALLKTLEEPPAHAIFIMATTEPQKFPVTIVSRCQHFVFKALPENALVSHLERILTREQIAYDERAVRLIARRAAGSVRDSMSLLGQTLALGEEYLDEASARAVLGLAGQELYERIIDAIARQDCVCVATLTRELLEAGADLGFFLRELAVLWRNLFLLRQAGEAALELVDMPEAETRRLLTLSTRFTLSAIHAAWQMTLEGQRQVLTSLEPSAALELLLLNLALLPRLASMELLSRACQTETQTGHAVSGQHPEPAPRPSPTGADRLSRHTETPSPATPERPAVPPRAEKMEKQPAVRPEDPNTAFQADTPSAPSDPASRHMPDTSGAAATPSSITPKASPSAEPLQPASNQEHEREVARPVPSETQGEGQATPPASNGEPVPPPVSWPCDWETFIAFCEAHLPENTSLQMPIIRQLHGTCEVDTLIIEPKGPTSYDQLTKSENKEILLNLACQCAGRRIALDLRTPHAAPVMEGELKSRMENHEAVILLQQHFNASLLRCTPRTEADASSHN